ADCISKTEALSLTFDRGRLLFPRQWYRGFRAALGMLARQVADHPNVRWVSPPEEITVLFDKRRCQERLAAAGVPIPASLGSPRCFDELWQTIRRTRRYRVFVKLACGSSASGVVAFMTDGRRF